MGIMSFLIPAILGMLGSRLSGNASRKEFNIQRQQQENRDRQAHWEAENRRLARANSVREILARRPDLADKMPSHFLEWLYRPRQEFQVNTTRREPDNNELFRGALQGLLGGMQAEGRRGPAPQLPQDPSSGPTGLSGGQNALAIDAGFQVPAGMEGMLPAPGVAIPSPGPPDEIDVQSGEEARGFPLEAGGGFQSDGQGAPAPPPAPGAPPAGAQGTGFVIDDEGRIIDPRTGLPVGATT